MISDSRRNIGQTEMYEPLIVHPFKPKKGYFQIINGFHQDDLNKRINLLRYLSKEIKPVSLLSEYVKDERLKASKNAAALTVMAEYLLDHWKN